MSQNEETTMKVKLHLRIQLNVMLDDIIQNPDEIATMVDHAAAIWKRCAWVVADLNWAGYKQGSMLIHSLFLNF